MAWLLPLAGLTHPGTAGGPWRDPQGSNSRHHVRALSGKWVLWPQSSLQMSPAPPMPKLQPPGGPGPTTSYAAPQFLTPFNREDNKCSLLLRGTRLCCDL